MKYLPSSKPRSRCRTCYKMLAITDDGRIKSPHHSTDGSGLRNCPGYGQFAVGHPTKPEPDGHTTAE